jgi:hypothetical protein
MNRIAPLAAALALFAAGCEQQAAEAPVQQGGEAAGEVLGGTISDAMIPLEQLSSEAPLLPRASAAPGAPGGAAADDAGNTSEGEPASEGAGAAPAAPAPEPAAEE